MDGKARVSCPSRNLRCQDSHAQPTRLASRLSHALLQILGQRHDGVDVEVRLKHDTKVLREL